MTFQRQEPPPRIGAPRLQLALELQAARKSAGLEPKQVANRIKCSADTIRRYERGDSSMSYAVLMALCDLYRITDERERAILGFSAQDWRTFINTIKADPR